MSLADAPKGAPAAIAIMGEKPDCVTAMARLLKAVEAHDVEAMADAFRMATTALKDEDDSYRDDEG